METTYFLLGILCSIAMIISCSSCFSSIVSHMANNKKKEVMQKANSNASNAPNEQVITEVIEPTDLNVNTTIQEEETITNSNNELIENFADLKEANGMTPSEFSSQFEQFYNLNHDKLNIKKPFDNDHSQITDFRDHFRPLY